MTSDEIFDKVMEEPFRPFRIRLRDGRTFDVTRNHSVAWCREGMSLKPDRIPIPNFTPDPHAMRQRYVVSKDDIVAFDPIDKEPLVRSA